MNRQDQDTAQTTLFDTFGQAKEVNYDFVCPEWKTS